MTIEYVEEEPVVKERETCLRDLVEGDHFVAVNYDDVRRVEWKTGAEGRECSSLGRNLSTVPWQTLVIPVEVLKVVSRRKV